MNFSKSQKDLGYRATVKYFESVLEKCHPSNVEFVSEEMKKAKQNTGETLIDIIIEIIIDDENSGHDCKLVTVD